MSKNPRDRNRVPGQGEGEEMENVPKKDVKRQPGDQGQHEWNQGQKGGQPDKGDMNRPKDTDEDMDDRTKRSA